MDITNCDIQSRSQNESSEETLRIHGARCGHASSVLKSKRAVRVNIRIVWTFTKLRELLASDAEMRVKVEKMDVQIQSIYKLLGRFMTREEKPKRRIGFRTGNSD